MKTIRTKTLLTAAVALTLTVTFATIAVIIIASLIKKDTPLSSTAAPTTVSQTSETTKPVPKSEEPSKTDQQPETLCGQIGGTCTAEQVAVHAKSNDCWVMYKNNYYDITNYIFEHPGGNGVFTSDVCGKDIEQFLKGQQRSTSRAHNHSASAYSDLEKYKIGPIK